MTALSDSSGLIISKIIFPILLIMTAKPAAVSLENWRQPFYNFASDFESSNRSPSGMFWDDITGASLFDPLLWPDSSVVKRNHWTLEPSVASGVYIPSEDDQNAGYYHLDLLNDIRYRSLFVRQMIDVDSRYEYDDFYPAHCERKARGLVEEAYGQFDWKYGFFRLGRLKRNWGPFPDRSLILSSYPYSYDAFEWQIHSSIFEFRHLFAAFPYEKSQMDLDNGNKTNRFFTAHSLNFMIGEWATLGVTEAVLFNRNNGIPDLQYVNPFSIYTITNTNQEGDGNLMLGFQWNVHPYFKNVSFKGQLLFDDFQVDHKIATDNEPTHWGMDLGLYWRNPLPISLPNLIKSEYLYRSEWLYTVTDENGDVGQRYTYLHKSLGYPDNDGDRISAGFQIAGKKFWALETDGYFSRKGIMNVNSRWRDSETGPDHINGLPFDTSYTMADTAGLSIGALGYFKNYMSLQFKADAAWVKNKGNIPGTGYEFNPSMSMELSFHFSNFKIFLPE